MHELVVTNEEQNLWTESLGYTGDTPILWIAGAGMHAHFWSDSFLAPFVEEKYFSIRFDHRGLGFSDSSVKEYDLNDLVNDALAILQAYNLPAAHIAGHSLGGYIAQVLAALHPEKVRSLLLLSTGPVGMTPDLKKPQTEEERWTLFETWKILMQNRPTDDFEESWNKYLQVWKRLNGSLPLDEDLARQYTEEFYTRSKHKMHEQRDFGALMQKVASGLEERKNLFSKITQPVFILHGGKDYFVPLERGGKALAKVLIGSELDIIQNMGHVYFNYDLEKEIAKDILTFLQNKL